jgi:glycine hydroxymethyltransferase
MAEAFVKRGDIISGEYRQPHDVDWFKKQRISGKKLKCISKAEITVNKNMVPFDDKSPTSGIRVGTPAITLVD